MISIIILVFSVGFKLYKPYSMKKGLDWALLFWWHDLKHIQVSGMSPSA